jgi:hypothetical protein
MKRYITINKSANKENKVLPKANGQINLKLQPNELVLSWLIKQENTTMTLVLHKHQMKKYQIVTKLASVSNKYRESIDHLISLLQTTKSKKNSAKFLRLLCLGKGRYS